ncbi:aspartic peptidase domain-containing protein [Fomitopsis serialis]|uniref:aspartic peptidase domain-containing protein n=1 Tax=Fomitopsis serialis TaxID=139415 RepID=UPI002007CF90|nr:aspartic peptidase domain-containing protein [Neoantrodia serialis]KAH9915119.1 aspartic peptidase domain-containing protein [Neoantrodia serialis]
MFKRYQSGLKCAAAAALLSAPLANAANTFTVPTKSSLAPFLAGFSSSNDPSAPATNAALKFVIPVQAGENQTFSEVLVDTGSAILWVGALDPYQPGLNSQVINETFSVGYGVGGVNGTAYKDRVTIGSATVESQIIGSAEYMYGFTLEKPIDGILGLGPSGSNGGEVSGSNTTPTFVENLVSEGTIDEPVFGIYVGPLSDSVESAGEITFGGIDESKISGDLVWLNQTPPYNLHWEFNATSFKWGNLTADPSTPSMPVRTPASSLSRFPCDDQFFDMLDMIPGTTLDQASLLSGSIVFPGNVTADDLPPLEIGIGSLLFNITADQYTVPASLYPSLNITDDGLTHTWIGSGGPSALDLGQKFLEHAYSAYDSACFFWSMRSAFTDGCPSATPPMTYGHPGIRCAVENHLIGFAYLA